MDNENLIEGLCEVGCEEVFDWRHEDERLERSENLWNGFWEDVN